MHYYDDGWLQRNCEETDTGNQGGDEGKSDMRRLQPSW